MKATALAVGLGTLLAGTPAFSQHPSGSPTGSAPDVPSGPATIRGQVIHTGRGGPIAGVELVLYALSSSGTPGMRRTTSDASGQFRFEGISGDPHTSYLVGARYRGIPFPGERVAFGPGELERVVEVKVSDPRPDASQIEVSKSSLRLERVGNRLRVTEIHQLRNPSSIAVYVPNEARRPERAGFRAELPPGAEKFTMPFGVIPEGVQRDGLAIAFYGPFYPGEQELRFSYELPSQSRSMEVRKRFPSATQKAVVQLPAQGFELKSPALHETGESQLDGRSYRQLETGPLAAGAALVLSLELPATSHDLDALSLRETRLFLELDDAALLAREEHRFEVEGSEPVVAPDGDLALSLPLPAGAKEIRFSPNAADFGLTEDPQGGAGLRGPLPAGESTIEIAYRIPVREPSLRLRRSFGKRLPLLSVFVADTGILATSERLHRRRPVRTPDRTFLHLEGFEIAAGEPVEVQLTPLPTRASLPRTVRIVFALAGALVSILVLIGPLRRTRASEADVGTETESTKRDEREAVYAAIRDLDHDFETGKLSREDFELLHRGLRTRAVALLRAEREAHATEEKSSEPLARVCTDCGAEGRPGDRFCAQCGRRLGAAPSTPGAAA